MLKKGKTAPYAVIAAASIILMLAAPAFSQVTATISGRLTDASRGVIAGAAVAVKSLENGAVRAVTTDESGSYRVPSLPLGAHEVRVEKPGFKAEVRKGLRLTVGQEAVVNFQLEVGEVTEAVTVSEEAPVVNTTTASTAGLVGEREVKDLPLNGRSYDALITLNPGAINYSAMKSANTAPATGTRLP